MAKKELSRELKAVKALNESHARTGAGFYVDSPGNSSVRSSYARLNASGQIEVREIREGAEHWLIVNPLTDTVRDGCGTRQIII